MAPDPGSATHTPTETPADDGAAVSTAPPTGTDPLDRDAPGPSAVTSPGRDPDALRADGGTEADDRPDGGNADPNRGTVNDTGAGGDVDAGTTAPSEADDAGSGDADDEPVVRITAGLLAYLLDRAETAEPESTSLVVGSTAAGEFETDLGLPPGTPILTHVYLPDAGRPVSAVFGVDLGTPAGRGRARFLSHPQGPLGVTRRDDLAAVVIVAVPPWDEGSFAAFDRSGRRLELRQLDAAPPDEPFGTAGE
jgi:hypothetical protein